MFLLGSIRYFSSFAFDSYCRPRRGSGRRAWQHRGVGALQAYRARVEKLQQIRATRRTRQHSGAGAGQHSGAGAGQHSGAGAGQHSGAGAGQHSGARAGQNSEAGALQLPGAARAIQQPLE